MILICSKCSASFAVPDNAIGPNGRLVRCSKCKNEWVATNPVFLSDEENKTPASSPSPIVETAPKVAEPKVEEVEAPVTAAVPEVLASSAARIRRTPPNKITEEKEPFYQWSAVWKTLYAVLIITLLGLISVTMVVYRQQVVHSVPMMQMIYDVFHLYQNNTLVFEKLELKPDLQQKILYITIPIRNIGSKVQKLSHIRITLFDDNMKKVSSLIITQKVAVKPNSEPLIVEGAINKVPQSATYVAVEMGNYIDFKMHNPKTITKIAINKMDFQNKRQP